MKFMPLGDSLTLGYTKVNGTGTVENGYRADLWARLYRRGVSPDFVGSCGGQGSCLPENPWPVVGQMGDWNHEGHAGWTTEQLADIAPARIATYRPDHVLLLTGANDLRLNRTVAEFRASLQRLLDGIHTANPAVHVFTATPTFKGSEPDWPAYAQVVTDETAARPAFTSKVPMHIIGQKAGELVDGVHPSRCGYARISYVWYYYLERSPKVNPSGAAWPTEYYPFGSPTAGPCAGAA